MCAATLLLLAALPALAGRAGWCADGEVVSVVEEAAGARGDGPGFAPRQRTSVLAPVGHAATLDCRVLRLRDKSVSWVRSRDLQILSHAGAVFTADARVSATSGATATSGMASATAVPASRHTLRIERLRTADAGRYECQVNTEPKMSLFFNLTVVDEPVPVVVVSVMGEAVVRGSAGGAATLACEARYEPPPRALPLPPLDVRWQKGDQPINLQSSRGGVALETARWAARVESRLTLAELRARDAGAYSCSATGRAATLTLLLDDEEDRAEAMQRDQAAGAGARLAPRALVALVSLATLLALAPCALVALVSLATLLALAPRALVALVSLATLLALAPCALVALVSLATLLALAPCARDSLATLGALVAPALLARR